MPETPVRKIHRFGPSGRFTRKQIREAIEYVRKLREQEAADGVTERSGDVGRGASHDAQDVHR
jgi:hypothetical protein